MPAYFGIFDRFSAPCCRLFDTRVEKRTWRVPSPSRGARVNAGRLMRWGQFLLARQHAVLVALLALLHLALLAGAGSPIGLTCWLVDVGLFLLWQPFVATERRLSLASVLLLFALVGAGAWFFGWWLLILWTLVLAALLGGRLMLFAHRATRFFYLTAFAYLLIALLVFLVPRIVPGDLPLGAVLDRPFALGAPLLFVLMLALPAPPALRPAGGGVVDLIYSLLVGLLVAVLVLGSLAFVVVSRVPYLEAVFSTLLTLAAMLLVVAWAWNPRPGFVGLGLLLSRSLLHLDLPFDAWLQRLLNCAEREPDPERFRARLLETLRELPWVAEVRCVDADEAPTRVEANTGPLCAEFPGQPLSFVLRLSQAPSPALLWHFRLLTQLANAYYLAKRHAQEIERGHYLRAVHETGARLTHDVKNVLQSLDNLCFLAQSGDEAQQAGVRRQLPLLAGRLRQTLEKLERPSGDTAADGVTGDAGGMPAAVWWSALRERHPLPWIEFSLQSGTDACVVPAALFDSVADNLLDNARYKQLLEPGLRVRVVFDPAQPALAVRDSGHAVAAAVAERLCRAPVPSANGFGIGLYQAAGLAAAAGFELHLAANREGRVVFELAPGGVPEPVAAG